MVKQRKLNKLTPIFDPTSYIVIGRNGTLIKVKEENSDRVVTRNISHFRRIPKDAVFPNNTSDESDDDFEYSRYDNNANHNQNTRRYPLRNRCLLPAPLIWYCIWTLTFWLAMQYRYFIIQEQHTFGLFSFPDDAVEVWSTRERCYDVM